MGSGNTTLIISNEEMNDIMKIIQALEDSDILLKGVTKTIKNETKEQKGGFLCMLLGTLRASLLGNLLTAKGILRAGIGNKKGKGILRAGNGNKKGKGILRAGNGNKKGKGILRAGTGNKKGKVLDDIVDKYNNTVHRTIKMKPILLKLRMIIKLSVMKIHLIKKS